MSDAIDPYRVVPTDATCPLCGHEWRRHDPEDGCCDAHAEEGFGACPCGRNRLWMAGRIAHLSKLFLIRAADERQGGLGKDEYPPCHECGGQPNIVYEPGGHKDYPAEQGRVFVCSTKHGWATWPEFVALTQGEGGND